MKVFALTVAYTALVGAVDGVTGADYMFLRSPPSTWSLLDVLGPWPWYILGATAIAILFTLILNMPFWWHRRSARSHHAEGMAAVQIPATDSVAGI